MSAWRQRWATLERPAGMALAGILLLALVTTTGALTARTIVADRMARRNAARSLEHLASVASWELARRTSSGLEMAARTTMSPVWMASDRSEFRKNGVRSAPSPESLFADKT